MRNFKSCFTLNPGTLKNIDAVLNQYGNPLIPGIVNRPPRVRGAIQYPTEISPPRPRRQHLEEATSQEPSTAVACPPDDSDELSTNTVSTSEEQNEILQPWV